jgi:hypothetical protein
MDMDNADKVNLDYLVKRKGISCPNSSQDLPSKKTKKQAKNKPKADELVTLARSEELKVGPPQKREKQNYTYEEDDDFQDAYPNRGKEEKPKGESDLVMEKEINIEDIDDFPDESNSIGKPEKNSDREELSVDKLCYKLKNKKREHPIREVNGLMECPSCAANEKNFQLNFTRNTKCADKIDTIHFQSIFA